VDALHSESRMANHNADIAYQTFQRSPSKLSLMVSKYSDLNADLYDASYHFNVINSGTIGSANTATSILGGFTNSLAINSLVIQRQETTKLTAIQKKMKRLQRQIQKEVQGQQNAANAKNGGGNGGGAYNQQQNGPAALRPGSTQQRLVALNAYGNYGNYYG